MSKKSSTFAPAFEKEGLKSQISNLKSQMRVMPIEGKTLMVVLAQLVEHRIVVPSVVGSSPTFHPKTAEIPFGIAAVFLCGCTGENPTFLLLCPRC